MIGAVEGGFPPLLLALLIGAGLLKVTQFIVGL